MSEVERSVDVSLFGGLEKVRDEQKWIPIFLRDFVKTTEIDTEVEGAILFMDEKNGVSEITEEFADVRDDGMTEVVGVNGAM